MQRWRGERLDDCGANQIESLRAKSEVVWSQLRARARCWYVTRRWEEMTRSTLRGEEKRESLDGHVGPKTQEAPKDMAGLIAESAPESSCGTTGTWECPHAQNTCTTGPLKGCGMEGCSVCRSHLCRTHLCERADLARA